MTLCGGRAARRNLRTSSGERTPSSSSPLLLFLLFLSLSHDPLLHSSATQDEFIITRFDILFFKKKYTELYKIPVHKSRKYPENYPDYFHKTPSLLSVTKWTYCHSLTLLFLFFIRGVRIANNHIIDGDFEELTLRYR